MKLDDAIRKHALQNAVAFGGKANAGAVIGRVISENPDMKSKVKEISKDVQRIVGEVNKLSVKKQEEALKKIAPGIQEHKKTIKRKELPELENAKPGNVVMRFEPSPSGPLHIGHAYTLSLNSELCRKYKGKLILRIADTNPENINKPSYEMIPKDAEWVTKGNVWETFVQSDRMEIYYQYAKELLEKGHAYVCTCAPEAFREAMLKQVPCQCRDIKNKEHLHRWSNMLGEWKEGSAVVRIKTNLKDRNPAMRDWPALRIKEAEHPRQGKKYRVWPLLNFAVAVDDHEMGITHTIRAKEHMDNEKRQKFIYDYMGWKIPQHLYIGRINFEGMRVSASQTRALIEKKEYSGWDDIRLPFLEPLRRRGYQPDAFIKYALDVGVSQTDKVVSKDEFFKTLNAFNRQFIDSTAFRYFFIDKPQLITIEKAPSQRIELDLHPDNEEGGRLFNTNEQFYVAKDDFNQFSEKKLYRLMDCLNFTKKNNQFFFDSKPYSKFKEKGDSIVHWLPKEADLAHVEVRMPDGSVHSGLGEPMLKTLKEGTVVQLERFGFCRLDRKEPDKLVFWYAHK